MSERRADEIRDLAEAVRELIERMVATEAPLDVFGGVAEEIRAVAARLGAYPQGPLYTDFAEAAMAGSAGGTYDNSPLFGLANPLAPPIRPSVEGDRVVARVRFGSAYEGPPGCVHGGYVAASFDEVLGLAQTFGGNAGMTGRLTVHYRSPTPLHTELRLVAWIDRIDGRKTWCKGTLHAGERLCAESEGLFIAIGAGKFDGLLAERQRRRTS